MREYYHRIIAKFISLWRMVVNIPFAIKQADEEFGYKDFLVITKRVAESRYYDKHATQQECGCYAIGAHYTSYLMDCEEHMKWLWEI